VNNAPKLAAVRTVHTAIYLVMAVATFALAYAGVTGQSGVWLWVAMALLAVEATVFASSGFKCPLSALAVSYGGRTGHVFDTLLPKRLTRYTFRFFATLMFGGLCLLAARGLGLFS